MCNNQPNRCVYLVWKMALNEVITTSISAGSLLSRSVPYRPPLFCSPSMVLLVGIRSAFLGQDLWYGGAGQTTPLQHVGG